MACQSRCLLLPVAVLTGSSIGWGLRRSKRGSTAGRLNFKLCRCEEDGDFKVLKQHRIPGSQESIQVWEGTRPFAQGTGVRTWPAAFFLLSYLQEHIKDSGEAPKLFWQKRRVLEVGCGCGLVALALASQGAEVTAVDSSENALALCAASRENLRPKAFGKACFQLLDWTDAGECQKLVRERGPFHFVVAADCVLANPPVGPMWRAMGAEACPPESLLEATRLLGKGAEVVLVVTDRVGDVAKTAQALLRRHQELEILALPRDEVLEGPSYCTVFHFRWLS